YGYGHAVGMSQYGADYMARQGSNYEEILKHYYKGAEITE
ncbi:MAG TPA: stage II sporulation protein D, partial [Clostridiales bacterium]|nr:stage II sporulation protein D [Clostridiales bacterium]